MSKRETSLTYEFVEFIPAKIQEGKLYISITYATATHKCFCGCEKEVVTPLSPTDWKLIFDGQSVSLNPSIGNWSFDCKSHYWIRRNRIIWSETWSEERIKNGREYDRISKNNHYNRSIKNNVSSTEPQRLTGQKDTKNEKSYGLWSKICRFWRSK